MTGATLRVEIDDAQARAALAELMRRGQDLSPLMAEIGSYLESETIERFVREAAPDGTPWRPSRRAREQGGQTLTDSARLRQSITHRAAGDAVEVGTNVIYAAAHQRGAVIRPRAGRYLRFPVPGGGYRMARQVTLPARPFLPEDGLPPAYDAAIQEIAGAYLLRGIA